MSAQVLMKHCCILVKFILQSPTLYLQHSPFLEMNTDIGSRHAPDVQADLLGAHSAPVALTDAQHQELQWLCSLIGCAVPETCQAAAHPSGPAPLLPPALLRLHLHDGRVYSGRLHCVDHRCNLLLAHCSQERGEVDGVQIGGFEQGQVLIAWRHVKRVERMKESKDE
jgi:small nuclear ribonucleoprotein (snRNP)-like protein